MGRSTLWVASAGLGLEDLVPKPVVYVSQSSSKGCPSVVVCGKLDDPEEEWDPGALLLCKSLLRLSGAGGYARAWLLVMFDARRESVRRTDLFGGGEVSK